MILELKKYIYNLIFFRIKFWVKLNFNQLIRLQIKNPKSIPIIIINFNQLDYLKKLIHFLQERKFENIIIIDNHSTYPPLLEYYMSLKNVKIEMMEENFGNMVFFKNESLQEKYGKGFFVLTDADIVPNENLPEDFMKVMMSILIKEFNTVNKVGFALDIENIPEYYVFKDKVIRWEKKFWKKKYKETPLSYKAYIDTTFAIYKPFYPTKFNHQEFLEGVRLAGDFTAIHGGWFVDINNLTEEQIYYQETSSSASSWLINKDGALDPKHSSKYL